MFNKVLKEKYRPVHQSGKAGSLSLFPKPSHPLQYTGLENSMDYNTPWGHKGSDATERFSLSLSPSSSLEELGEGQGQSLSG